jgi:hypothetical protein
VIFSIIAIVLIGSFNIQNSYGHDPNFEVETSEDILKFCEFFYEEYQLLGAETLAQQHTNFPNLRACVILYNHIAWNSTHQARNLVLVAEIEKHLVDSKYIRERHIEYSDTIPDWVKRDAQLWVNNESQDVGFAYGIRTLLEAEVLKLDLSKRECIEKNICFKDGDYIKYSHFDKFGNVLTIKHSVESINENEIVLNVEKISHEGIAKEELLLDKKGIIKTSECCQYYEFLVPLPINLGDSISEDIEIVAETTYLLDNEIRQSWVARDSTGQNVKIIDKKSGLVLSYEFHETEVLTVGDETKITDTNFFNTKYNMELHQTVIPEWWKITTSWLLEEKISESEYLRAMENLISRNILRV